MVDYPVEVTYRSFELDPTAKRDINENMYEMLANKYGMSLEQAKANSKNVINMAEEVGLDFQLDSLILTNTFDAHRLATFAKKYSLMKEMTERILHAYFTESEHIGDHGTLTELAVEVGLDREAVVNMLANGEMTDEVRADEQQAKELRITGVPFFLINKKYSLNGAQPAEAFVQAFEQVKADNEA
ncbi:thioredoxin domain-containing protein [Aquibacillus halophilus]|uniref:Thioredoxin domain-containing protein n=2 Tax=Aquibacillus halophilus TaxID=930132 RepID=A0A6A8DKQ3_9BACI|nr:thioredoxin domain-containing protein [Aquibacillus halophilus]